MEKVGKNIANIDYKHYPWCTIARLQAVEKSDKAAAIEELLQTNRRVSSLKLKSVDVEVLAKETQGEIIDRFLRLDDYRVVADDKAEVDEICTEADLEEQDDIVTEEIAEIFAAQGLKSEAVEIYRKLSLLNPKKSAYFASQIEKLQKL